MHLFCMTRRKKQIWKGALAGLVGGLAGSFAMNEFQAVWSKAAGKQSNNHPAEPATVKAARMIVEKGLHRRLPESQKGRAGELVHYAFGTLSGAIYGALSERAPLACACAGTLFGAALFALVDEGLVPLVGLSGPPNQYPLSSHVYAFASHLVYGSMTDAVRDVVRAAL